MKKLILALVPFTASLLSVSGADSAAKKAPTEKGTPVPARKSTFKVASDARNPFWPIGWVRKAPVATATTTETPRMTTTIRADQFNVTSISLNPYRVVVVNGKDYAEGDTMKLTIGQTVIPVQIVRVTDGEVIFRGESNEVVVKIKTR